jgi:hypothetical protein
MNSHKNPQKGFTILVAVVTAGILLIIAMSIGGIALKEQMLSTANKESQIAFYAADTGMECALYWDQKMGVFSPNTDPASGDITNPAANSIATITCGGNTFSTDPVNIISSSPNKEYRYSFKMSNIPVEGGPASTCAIVTVVKDSDDDGTVNGQVREPTKTYTDIYSYGYNTCGPSLTRLERGIEGHY